MRRLPSHAVPLTRQAPGGSAVTFAVTLMRRRIIPLQRRVSLAPQPAEGDEVEEVEGTPFPTGQGYTSLLDCPPLRPRARVRP